MTSVGETFSQLVAAANTQCDRGDSKGLSSTLELTTSLLKSQTNRTNLTHENWTHFSTLFNRIESVDGTESEKLRLISEIFRILRNACVQTPSNQNFARSAGAINFASDRLSRCLSAYSSQADGDTKIEMLALMKCGLQFLGNVASGNPDTQEAVLAAMSMETFRTFLEFSDDKVFTLTTMVLYNCSFNSAFKMKLLTPEFVRVMDLLLDNLGGETSSEWSLLTVGKGLEVGTFLEQTYFNLVPKSRVVLLDVMYELLRRDKDQSTSPIFPSNVSQIGKMLSEKLLDIFRLAEQSSVATMGALEIPRMLSVVCKASCFSNYVDLLRHKSLVESVIDTLKALHLLAKSDSSPSSSIFKPIERLSQFSKSDEEPLEQSPTYGFKRDLIRLLANLSHGCLLVQTWVRELDGIPLILDCCRLDARNPFIMQWCIFAIHNLLENNPENQAIIAALEQNGILMDSPLLKELGLECKDGKIIVSR